jgi:S-adenosylmethionine decarboxylase
MSRNALLRSGRGLGIPGTARKDERKSRLKLAAPAPSELGQALLSPLEYRVHPPQAQERSDHFALRNGVRCAGVHLIIDLHGAERLDDIGHIEATLLHIHLHHFDPNGVSGVAVLAESHISIHTWPDAGYAALDVFMCGAADPDACIPVLREAFGAKRVGVNEVLRGQAPERA